MYFLIPSLVLQTVAMDPSGPCGMLAVHCLFATHFFDLVRTALHIAIPPHTEACTLFTPLLPPGQSAPFLCGCHLLAHHVHSFQIPLLHHPPTLSHIYNWLLNAYISLCTHTCPFIRLPKTSSRTAFRLLLPAFCSTSASGFSVGNRNRKNLIYTSVGFWAGLLPTCT